MNLLTKLTLSLLFCSFLFVGTTHAQTNSVSETFKKHFNETVQNVKNADTPTEQRALLNDSFADMLQALNRIDESAELSKDEEKSLLAFKNEIKEKQSELNGWNGFDEIQDDELIDFSDYSQQELEQANRTLTLSLTSALLIVLILLLL
jgi:hypothetical protein